MIGRLAGDPDAYSYLPNSVRRFPGPRNWRRSMRSSGLGEIRYVLTAGGIIALHVGVRERPEAAVQTVVEAGGGRTARLMERLEERMAELASGHGALLGRHAETTLAAGGKRLRPLLVFLAAGRPPETEGFVRAAVAVELVHAATLVHDDVIDRGGLHHGRPTVVAAGGASWRGDRRPALLARLRRAGGGG